MPKILVYKNLIFFFFAGDINKRAHLHIVNNKSFADAAKIWFKNGVEIFEQGSLTKIEINEAEKVIIENIDFLIEQWNKF